MSELRTACMSGDIGGVSELLAAGDNLHQEHDGVALVEWVAEAGLVEVGKLLVDHGAHVDICTAASFGLIDVVRGYLDKDPSAVHATRRLFAYQPIHCASECGFPDILILLLERGAVVNARNEWGFAPLHLAIIAARDHEPTKQHYQCVDVLLKHGADVKAVDAYGTTIHGIAKGTVEYGKEHGYDPAVPAATLKLIEDSLE